MTRTTMVPNSDTHQAQAPDPLNLAVERTYLANERTLLAWIRTATSLIAFGFGLYKFFYFVHQQDPTRHANPVLGAHTFGMIMITFGLFALALATVQHHKQIRRLKPHYPDRPVSLALVLAGLIAGLGILGLLAAVFRQ
jgi:putative membrane protein